MWGFLLGQDLAFCVCVCAESARLMHKLNLKDFTFVK